MDEKDVAEALLNYAPFEHGFFWWGGYGVSTEHTAYLNLKYGIPAPESGSSYQNGEIIAEQIGGQIFIDCWGLVSPGNPEQAAYLAKKAASVTHDGEGIFGGIFVSCCISAAFEKTTIEDVIETALHYIPRDCTYAKMVHDIQNFYKKHPEDWRLCMEWIQNHYGYDKYGGNCHIIPNAAVMVLSLLYGNGEFSKTINICNMCGWDTDCNVGNIGAIMGVYCGIDGIDFEKWVKELQDLLICSSTLGYLNIRTISDYVSELTIWAYQLAGENLPSTWKSLEDAHAENCHFEFPGAIHGFGAYIDDHTEEYEVEVVNSSDYARSGNRSLKVEWPASRNGNKLFVSRRSYYFPEEFYDSRYNPAFSPKVYPGQKLQGWIYSVKDGFQASVWAKDKRSGACWSSESVNLTAGKWIQLEWRIPSGLDACIYEYGFCVESRTGDTSKEGACFYFDDVMYDEQVDYVIDFAKETEEVWTNIHREVSQFTRMKDTEEIFVRLIKLLWMICIRQ